ncbi:tetratricopeptide domain protein [Metarhizium robertsii]|uniref:ER membrane protein complex subunit 2 n=2 Tax=Metarhizium robertsii TaxID=568076 RepID=E9F3Q3_METRA|nr:tetratricopeptide repeat domain-containing protein [Metarhizium robertsii ARSEF 23]EFY97589.1 tetratricopeptide repeat domain-containing protein [Metarhizium robertsii ARSEF 23]EXV05072.1 tetratricopeptide domain protein [Metarhizium robertsii]
MAESLLQPVGSLSPAEALKLAQQAPEILRKNPKAFSASPLSSLFSTRETADTWTIYENLMIACLQAGDDEAANECLERIVNRFGDSHDRVLALKGLVKEATASNNSELEKILEEYEALLQQNDASIPIRKRKVALLRSMGRLPEAVTALNSLLDVCPTDPEAWAELADMYVTQGLYSQAVYALEEVLVLSPNAWNIHARLGEVSFMAATTASEGGSQKHYAEAVKRFCRSIELCDDYLRGYYGLKLVTDKLVQNTPKSKKDSEGFQLPDQATIEKLNEAATKKLGEIVRRNGAKDKLWQGYDAREIAAARELLDSSSARVVR